MAMVSRSIGDVVSEIKMTRTAFSGGLLVVEGPSDAGFFAKRVADGPKQIIIAGAKATVSGSILAAYSDGLLGIVGVIDDDYDSICGVAVPSPHVVRTEARDLEALLISSPALDAVLHEVADSAKVKAVEQAEGCPVRQALSNRAIIFGKLRLVNRRQGWNLDFDEFKPWRFANKPKWLLDEPAIIALASTKAGVAATGVQALLAAITAQNPYVLLHGRDTLAVLQIGLSNKIGDESFSIENLCRMLRLAFNNQMATNCPLFQALRAWEAANAPFRILS